MTVARLLVVFGTLLAVSGSPANAEQPEVASDAAVVSGEIEIAEGAGDDDAVAVEEEVVPPLLAKRAELLEAMSSEVDKLDELTEQLPNLIGEERLVVLGQIAQLEIDSLKVIDQLVDNAEKSRSAELETADLDAYLEDELPTVTPYLIDLIEESQASVLEIAATRDDVPQDQLLPFEERLADFNARVDRYYEILLEQAERMERVGLDGEDARSYIRTHLPVRADRVAGRVELAREQVATLEQRLKASPDDATAAPELRAAESKLAWGVASLTSSARVLGAIDVPTSQYRQLLIRATGAITEDILDVDVARGLLDESLSEAREWVRDNGATAAFRLMLLVLIVLAARVIGGIAGRIVRRALKTSRIQTSPVLQGLLAALVRRGIIILGFLFGLSQIGIEIGPLLAGMGIMGFAVGFALQDTLSNFAAGAMLLLYRPFDVGDVVEVGSVLGKVDQLSLVNTSLLTFDNQMIVVPNNKIWGGVITNITAMDVRRVDISIGVAYSERVGRVEALLMDVVKAHPKVLDDPAPAVRINKLEEAGVAFAVRPWARTEDYWEVYWDLNRAIKERFEEEAIAFAGPRRHFMVEAFQPPASDAGHE